MYIFAIVHYSNFVLYCIIIIIIIIIMFIQTIQCRFNKYCQLYKKEKKVLVHYNDEEMSNGGRIFTAS